MHASRGGIAACGAAGPPQRRGWWRLARWDEYVGTMRGGNARGAPDVPRRGGGPGYPTVEVQ